MSKNQKEENKKEDKVPDLTPEQRLVIKNKKKKLVVSASAGSGKTFVVVEKLIRLICEENIPVSRLLVLTFTKAAASELKSRLYAEILKQTSTPFLIEQLDDILVSDITTIDSFCEKIIKRNINSLSLPQNFGILDEKGSKKLKSMAFRRAFDSFSASENDKFEHLYFAFKRNSDMLEECMLTIQAFFDSDNEGEKLKEHFKSNLNVFHVKACENLKEIIKNSFSESEKYLQDALTIGQASETGMAQQHVDFASSLQTIVKPDFSKDFFDICKDVSCFKMPAISTAKCDKDAKSLLVKAKEVALEGFEICQTFQFANDKIIASCENGVLSGILLEFFDYYIEEYKRLKEKRNVLDFADLERYAKQLIEIDEVKKSLQSRYDYIVIDEYQDTNRLQEAILKPIAEKGHFIAVGDLKQGIYAFRNANKDIMSEDIENFKNDKKNGKALYLKGNFRTDERILDFVNQLFKEIMTEKSAGIDYADTSILEGKTKFLGNSLPATRVDIVWNGKEKTDKKEAEENKKDIWADIYSVKDDAMKSGYENIKEILAIESRIEEVLQEKIYMPKQKAFKQVEEGDIALLFRNRSSLMQELSQYLEARGYRVNADIKENLLEDSQIALIVSLLKLSINLDDDIPLASVMASPFGRFSLEELSQIRLQNPQEKFYEAVKNSDDQKIKDFLAQMEEFKFDIHVFGIIKALERIFNKTDYLAQLQQFEDGEMKRGRINKLFALIRSGDLDFSPQEVISTLEHSQKEDKQSSDGGNSITITTIHATKGLEYPIVILCGAGEKLGKAYNKNFIATKEYGLASHVFDFENNFKMMSPAFLMGKLAKKKSEFVDELMLFYVATTRAKNHLYIIGKGKKEDYSFEKLENQTSYLNLIFFALGENFVEQVFEQEEVTTKNCKFTLLTDFEECGQTEKINQVNDAENGKTDENIQKLYDFSYPNKEFCKISLKNSVTGINKLSKLEEYQVGETLFVEKEEKPNQANEQKNIASKKAIEIGNSYHEALRFIDFSKVEKIEDLEIEFEKIKAFMNNEYIQNIDLNLLYKNIMIVKEVIKGNIPFKEKEFIMECDLDEIGVLNGEKNLSLLTKESNKLIVQGIVDLFAMGEKLILIDYKYTSTIDEKTLVQRYQGQIYLYEKALEKAFGRKVDEKYLLSLKEGKLIKID